MILYAVAVLIRLVATRWDVVGHCGTMWGHIHKTKIFRKLKYKIREDDHNYDNTIAVCYTIIMRCFTFWPYGN